MSAKFSPELFFETVNGYYRTAAVRAAVELDLFSITAEAPITAESLACACRASQRGVRMLCDYLVHLGFLCKSADRYFMTPDVTAFLDKKSPGYLGGSLEFFLAPDVTAAFANLTDVVRAGELTKSRNGVLDPDDPLWVTFARAMQPMMILPSFLLADLVDRSDRPQKVLDVGAGHGLFGIAFARRNPRAQVIALDWANVLAVARENAKAAEVIDQCEFLPGDAFDVDFGHDYDVILFANFLHHFDKPTCEKILAKARRSLAVNGRVIAFDFIADEGKTSPALAATFLMTMLATTPAGDVYTQTELQQMFANAGFSHSECRDLKPALQKVVISRK